MASQIWWRHAMEAATGRWRRPTRDASQLANPRLLTYLRQGVPHTLRPIYHLVMSPLEMDPLLQVASASVFSSSRLVALCAQAELLGGQKLQGVLTSNEVQQVLDSRGWQQDYPLFVVIHAIANGRLHPSAIFRFKEAAKQLHEQES